MVGRWWEEEVGCLSVRAVVRVQLCVCTTTMLLVYCLTTSRSGIEFEVLDRVKGVGCMVARLKESKVWSRWMWEKQTGWFFLGPKPKRSHTLSEVGWVWRVGVVPSLGPG